MQPRIEIDTGRYCLCGRTATDPLRWHALTFRAIDGSGNREPPGQAPREMLTRAGGAVAMPQVHIEGVGIGGVTFLGGGQGPDTPDDVDPRSARSAVTSIHDDLDPR